MSGRGASRQVKAALTKRMREACNRGGAETTERFQPQDGETTRLGESGRGVFEPGEIERSENALQLLRPECGNARCRLRFHRSGRTIGMFNTARRHQSRGALVIRAGVDFVQPIVQLGRSREADGEHEGQAKQRDHGGTCAGILAYAPEGHGQECAATPNAAQLTSEDRSFSRTPTP